MKRRTSSFILGRRNRALLIVTCAMMAFFSVWIMIRIFAPRLGMLVSVSHSPDGMFSVEQYEAKTFLSRFQTSLPGHGGDCTMYILRLRDHSGAILKEAHAPSLLGIERPIWTGTSVVYRGVGNPNWILPVTNKMRASRGIH